MHMKIFKGLVVVIFFNISLSNLSFSQCTLIPIVEALGQNRDYIYKNMADTWKYKETSSNYDIYVPGINNKGSFSKLFIEFNSYNKIETLFITSNNIAKSYEIERYILNSFNWSEYSKDVFKCGGYQADISINSPDIGMLTVTYTSNKPKQVKPIVKENINYYRIKFLNTTNETVYLAAKIMSLSGEWKTLYWYEINPNEKIYIEDTNQKLFFYHAYSTKRKWEGRFHIYIENKLYLFEKADIFNSGYGDFVVTFKY
jgi:hypothetical protein